MKKLFLFLLLGCVGLTVQAQDPDPQLFRTWYLTFVVGSDLGTPYTVSEISPPITPTLSVAPDLTFTGGGACNYFEGNFISQAPNVLLAENFIATLDDCDGIPIHLSFEFEYFQFINSGFWFEINPVPGGLQLICSNAIFGEAIFNDFPLSVPENALTNIRIYPNPVSDNLVLVAPLHPIDRIMIHNSMGQLVYESTDVPQQLPVAYLDTGMYILTALSKKNSTTIKFIKE